MLDTILKKDNIYFLVESSANEVQSNQSIIIGPRNYSTSLYNGRVQLTNNHCHHRQNYIGQIMIDGLFIYDGRCEYSDLTTSLSFATIVSYLNQMETFGIKSFLENYKKALLEFKEGLLEYDRLLSMHNDSDRRRLGEIEGLLYQLNFLIFNLSKNLSDNNNRTNL